MWKEKRRFSRYKKNCRFELAIAGNNYPASILDYSLDGFGALIEGDPPLDIGDPLSITIDQMDMRGSGRVVWKFNTDKGIKVGIARISILNGLLRDFPVADVLIGFQRGSRTGVLYVVSGKVQKKIYLNKGDIIFASSNMPEDSPGMVLVNLGMINKSQFDQATLVERLTKKRPDEIYSELGFVDLETVMQAVGTSVENIIYSLFQLREGQFVLIEEGGTPDEIFRLKLSTAHLIYRGIMSIEDEEHINSLRPAIHDIPYLADDPLNLFQAINLATEDKEVLRRCNGSDTAGEILDSYGDDEGRVIKVLSVLLNTRLIDFKESTDDPPVLCPDNEESECIPETGAFVSSIEHLYGIYKELGYYGVLEIDKSATKAEIKKAFYAKAKEFHPDRHFGMHEEMQEKINEIFLYISNAYNTLMDEKMRSRYDNQDVTAVDAKQDPEAFAASRYEEGRTALREARLKEAVLYFSEAVYYAPSAHPYHFALGVAYYRTGKYKESESAFRQAISLDPSNAQYIAESGHAFLAMGYPVRAKGSFEKALLINPKEKRALEGIKKLGPVK